MAAGGPTSTNAVVVGGNISRSRSPIGVLPDGTPINNMQSSALAAQQAQVNLNSVKDSSTASRSSPTKAMMDSVRLFLKMTDEERAEKYVNSQYLCKRKLGSGGFGEVWSCIDLRGLADSDQTTVKGSTPDEHTYAMKIENL